MVDRHPPSNPPSKRPRLLILSNGHGEDQVAIRIALECLKLAAPPEITALPIVGAGSVYQRHHIPMLEPVQVMPSGGFIYMDGRQTLRDLKGGLGQLTWRQLQAVRAWAQQGGLVLAVGDIVPLLFAWWSGAHYAFIGTAKSDFYLCDRNGDRLPNTGHPWWLSRSVYLPWERWLMQRPHCRAVFPRDQLTATTLQQWPIPVVAAGNPMMDNLDPQGKLASLSEPQGKTVLLLPGSRAPEAYANWQLILRAVKVLVDQGQPLRLIAAIAPGLDLSQMQAALQDWQPVDPHTWTRGTAQLLIAPGTFNDGLARADVAIAMAGTATEQAVGIGIPVITFPGQGPQFTAAFAEAQTRLLGTSILMVQTPEQISDAWTQCCQTPAQQWQTNGHLRMGSSGATQRITKHLQQLIQ